MVYIFLQAIRHPLPPTSTPPHIPSNHTRATVQSTDCAGAVQILENRLR